MMRALHPVPDAPPRAVLYLRQSTYREESISLELQETAGRDYCARMGYTVIDVQADPGVSGRTWQRPAVQRVLDMVEGDEADVIVLWRWSRLSRSRKDWAVAADRVDVAGGRIESATEPNDVTAAGRFARGVMTELAAFESERIAEQWKEVHDRRRSRGLPGGGKIPYGWKYSDDGSIVQNPEQAPAIAAMYEMYLSGAGMRTITGWLQSHGYRTYSGRTDWQPASVTQTLDSAFHAGFVVHRGELLPGAHEAIVDEVTWRRYRAMRAERANRRTPQRRYLLSGLMYCHCGAKMFGFFHKGKQRPGHSVYTAYRCAAISTSAMGDHGPATIATGFVEQALAAWLQEVAADVRPQDTAPRVDSAKLEAQQISRELTQIEKQTVTLTEGLASGLVPEQAYRATMGSLSTRREALTAILAAVESQIVLAPENPRQMATDLLRDWDILPLDTKRAMIHQLAPSIVIDCRPKPRTMTINTGWLQDPASIDL